VITPIKIKEREVNLIEATAWRTSDYKVFKTEVEALDHEKNLKISNKVQILYDWEPENGTQVVRFNNAEQFEAFAKVHKHSDAFVKQFISQPYPSFWYFVDYELGSAPATEVVSEIENRILQLQEFIK
jgi:hypothetical protein